MNNLYDVLETCLQDIEAGADIESVLFRYPDLADELRPILETSMRAKGLAVSDPSATVVMRNRAKLLQHAAQMREAKVQPSRRLWSVPLRRALVTLAVIAALFMSGTGLVRAASTTLPGDGLYPVKRTWEDILTAFTFDTQLRQALEIEHENERLDELYEIFAEGRFVQVDFAGLVTRQNGDLWLVSKIPVVISAQTDLRDPLIQIGDAVRVRGFTQTDGTVLADRVELLSEGMPLPEVDEDDLPEIEQEKPEDAENDNEDNSGEGSEGEESKVEETNIPEPASDPEKISINGAVGSINGNILIVNAQPMDIGTAEIKGTPKVGSSVKVEGYYDANGIFIVTKIEFISSDTNSGSDTNSNDSVDDGNSDTDNSNGNSNSSGKDDNGGSDDNDNSNDNGGGDD
ncbi:MAG: DUF5666 domain-containing protein [Chloroflexota bacterium]